MFLRQLPSHEERLNRLRDWDYFHSREWEENQFLTHDLLSAAGQTSPVARFVRAFIRRARAYGVPLYCVSVAGDTCEVHHCQWLDRLSLGERAIYQRLGLDVQDGAKVRFADSPNAYQWEVEAKGEEARFSSYPWREPTHDEINERVDRAAYSSARIVELQTTIEFYEKLLRDEKERLRLGRWAE